MMNREYLETQVRLELINAYAKYNYFLAYSDDSRKTFDLIRDYSDEKKDGCETIVSHMTWHEVVSVIMAMYCIMQHECLEEEKEKTAEKMFNDLDYKKRIEDGCIKFERHTENVDEGLIEFDLDTKTICASWFMEQKEITIAELRAINKQAEELGWI